MGDEITADKAGAHVLVSKRVVVTVHVPPSGKSKGCLTCILPPELIHCVRAIQLSEKLHSNGMVFVTENDNSLPCVCMMAFPLALAMLMVLFDSAVVAEMTSANASFAVT